MVQFKKNRINKKVQQNVTERLLHSVSVSSHAQLGVKRLSSLLVKSQVVYKQHNAPLIFAQKCSLK